MSCDERKPGKRVAESFISDINDKQAYIHTENGIRYQVLGGRYYSDTDEVFIQIDPQSWCYDGYVPYAMPTPVKVIFNDPATIVFWGDKSKTVVKCTKDDIFDPEKGFAMCIMKKVYGNAAYKYALKSFIPKTANEKDSNNADN